MKCKNCQREINYLEVLARMKKPLNIKKIELCHLCINHSSQDMDSVEINPIEV